MSNVLTLKQRRIPDDLMTFREIEKKYGYKYGFLYKWTITENEIPCYDKRGFISIRESDFIKFIEKRTRKWQA